MSSTSVIRRCRAYVRHLYAGCCIEEDGGGDAYAAFSDFILEPETIRTVLPMLTPSFRAVMLSTIAKRLKPRSWYQRRWRRKLSDWMDDAAVSTGSGGM